MIRRKHKKKRKQYKRIENTIHVLEVDKFLNDLSKDWWEILYYDEFIIDTKIIRIRLVVYKRI